MRGIVLDPRTDAEFPQRFQIVAAALFQPLFLDQLALPIQFG